MPKHTEDKRLITAVAPPMPVWAVYYDEEKDDIFVFRILYFTIWETTFIGQEGTVKEHKSYPVPLMPNDIEEMNPYENDFFGFTDNPNTKREDWETDIDSCKDSKRRRLKKNEAS